MHVFFVATKATPLGIFSSKKIPARGMEIGVYWKNYRGPTYVNLNISSWGKSTHVE